jgi:hypothetical protein
MKVDGNRFEFESEQELDEWYERELYDEVGEMLLQCMRRIPQDNLELGHCAYFAVMNLHLMCGIVPPPSLERMLEIQPTNPVGGLEQAQIAGLLRNLNFPRRVTCNALPLGQTFSEFLPPLLEQGYLFILAVNMHESFPRERCEAVFGDADFAGVTIAQAHAVIPYAANFYGVSCVTSWPGREGLQMYPWQLYPAFPFLPAGERDPAVNRFQGFSRAYVMVAPGE